MEAPWNSEGFSKWWARHTGGRTGQSPEIVLTTLWEMIDEQFDAMQQEIERLRSITDTQPSMQSRIRLYVAGCDDQTSRWLLCSLIEDMLNEGELFMDTDGSLHWSDTRHNVLKDYKP